MGNLRIRAILGKKGRSIRIGIIAVLVTVGYILTLGTSVGSAFLSTEYNDHLQSKQGAFPLRKLLSTENDSGGVYPKDAFTTYQLEHGAFVVHILGLIYMFVAVAIVCDEFFVPSLGVIIERLNLSEDVAGATFMAAGGSAPELFISIIGVFLANNNVGIGTIVGSAVFNILFVIGMCALFSKEVLKLTWWPLFRDVSFYSFDLILLIVFFLDGKIDWWEALLLFLCYFMYVLFMKFNHNIERAVKGCLQKASINKVQSTDSLLNEKTDRSCSLPFLHAGAGRFRHGMLQLMIHTIDPIGNGEAKVDDKAMHMHAMATLQVLIDAQNKKESINGIQNGAFDKSDTQIHTISNGQVSPDSNQNGETRKSPSASQETTLTMLESDSQLNGKVTKRDVDVSINNNELGSTSDIKSETSPNFEEVEEPMDLSWPDTCRERFTYILIIPIVFILWITLPDVRRPEKRKWFFVSFIGSILWIGGFSYLMVWWANTVGVSIGIPDEVMGLTILAAGTSIPDLITSVIVAKKGFGDMAVSSSVGSNIFDITVGLPFPWLLNSAIQLGEPTKVSSEGLLCSIVLLFVMLIAVISTIALSKWKMSKLLGCSMFVLYVIFLTLSVLLELGYIKCPEYRP